MKRKIWLIAILFYKLGISTLHASSSIIDLNNLEVELLDGYEDYDWRALRQKYRAFNEAMEIAPVINHLKKNYNIDIAVETGTRFGETTALLGTLFDHVHSIEINKKAYRIARKKLRDYSNIRLHLGSSDEVLATILPQLQAQKIIFYLDAHWLKKWPLLQELQEISKTHADNCIIVIDDFKVPGREEIPFDSYQGKDCELQFIEKKLHQIFSDYVYFYLIPKRSTSRAKFVVMPKSWSDEDLLITSLN
jgi:predicted O-methyltransferase YrrM